MTPQSDINELTLIEFIAIELVRRGRMLKNNTCQMSDWDAASLSVGAESTDATPATLFSIYGRYHPGDVSDAARRCRGRPDDVTDAVPPLDEGQ